MLDLITLRLLLLVKFFTKEHRLNKAYREVANRRLLAIIADLLNNNFQYHNICKFVLLLFQLTSNTIYKSNIYKQFPLRFFSFSLTHTHKHVNSLLYILTIINI